MPGAGFRRQLWDRRGAVGRVSPSARELRFAEGPGLDPERPKSTAAFPTQIPQATLDRRGHRSPTAPGRQPTPPRTRYQGTGAGHRGDPWGPARPQPHARPSGPWRQPDPRPARQHLAVHCGRARSPGGRGKEDAGGCRAGVSLGPGRGDRALPLSPARRRLPGFQDGRRGGAESLQPFPLPVREPRPLAGLSRRRKRHKRRKFAVLRKRILVLWLPAPIIQLQNLVTPKD